MLNRDLYIYYIENVLLAIYLTVFLIQIYYYLRFYTPVLFLRRKKSKNQLPLSVVICARNEAQNLQNNLAFIMDQDYPDFEVIVVNDTSTDNTDEVMGEFLHKYKNLRMTHIPLDRKFSHGKKLALTVGIKAAKNEHIVFTDADCRPESRNWLNTMQAAYKGKDIVLGYGGYLKKFGLLNNYIRFDTLTIALQYFGFALAKKPYMGVGRNLAYKKQLFFDNKGFANHYGIQSGDDDLFINEVATSKNTGVQISKDSFTRSVPKNSWGDFFNQKLRHLSTSGNYKSKHIFMLGLEPLSRAWFYTLFILLWYMKSYEFIVVALAGIRLVLQIIVYSFAGIRFKERNLMLTCTIFDVYSLFFNFVAYLALSIRSRKIRWK